MTSQATSALKEFFNKLADHPVEPTDPEYVPILEEHSKETDPIKAMATRISWSESASVNLLSGQRGTGKSTELRRLRSLLVHDGCVVFLCDMRDYLNLTTAVEITDFLISVMGALGEAVRESYNQDLASETFWTRLRNFLQ